MASWNPPAIQGASSRPQVNALRGKLPAAVDSQVLSAAPAALPPTVRPKAVEEGSTGEFDTNVGVITHTWWTGPLRGSSWAI